MHGLLLTALLFQVRAGVVRDTTDTARANINLSIGLPVSSGANRREPKRIPVTEEHLRTAFASDAARSLLARARLARVTQDSLLTSYEAKAYFRMSAGMGFSKIGRDRLLFRHENVANVRWHRNVGAWIDVAGARTALPVAGTMGEKEAASEVTPELASTVVPYFPGQEPLLAINGTGVVESQVDEREMVHPIAEGAEAYYLYEAGDSVTFRLPDGRSIGLRELRVRPRESKWNVAVGSLWFDGQTGQLVRAAYRLAVPMDVWSVVEEEEPRTDDEVPFWVKPIISPMRAQINAVAVEYGLHQGRFWLPRLRSMEGGAQVSFMRVPFKLEQSYSYSSVNALDSLPEIKEPPPTGPPDSLSGPARQQWLDSARAERRARRLAQRDSIAKGLKTALSSCDSTGTVTTVSRQAPNLLVARRIPCDVASLANSPELPGSIYDEGEEIFGTRERDALILEALGMGAQPPIAIGAIPPSLQWGLEFTRFNRVEGLSSGVLIQQQLGGGYATSLFGRIGYADLKPNVELTLERTNYAKTIRLRGYEHLVAANDWGNPLSFGSSLSSFLFGRDEGFYYRSRGAELHWEVDRGTRASLRLFAEKQRPAIAENTFSLGPAFIPNVAARVATYAGAAVHLSTGTGLDVEGFRSFTDLRLESAASDSAGTGYGRGALEVTVTQGMGAVAAALTMSGGTSAGDLPPQRRWYLGGAQTIRGQYADTAQSGNAYWMGRFELARAQKGVRPIVFGDIGWVGNRDDWRSPGRPLSGVGVGASVLDGLIRFDAARGLWPRKGIRLDLYVEARF